MEGVTDFCRGKNQYLQDLAYLFDDSLKSQAPLEGHGGEGLCLSLAGADWFFKI